MRAGSLPPAPLSIAVALGAVTVSAIVALAFDPDPFALESAAAIALGGGLASIASMGGLLLARSPWARRAAFACCALWFGVSIAGPLDVAAFISSALAILTAGAAAGPWLGRWLRRLPAADGPPPVAVAVLLSLMATPALIGLLRPTGGLGGPGWVLTGWSLALAWLIARALGPSLWLGRVVHAPLALACVTGFGVVGVVLVAKALAEAAIVWRRDMAIALRPLLPPPSSAVPIPPELVDPGILQAAGLDDRGRPLEPS